MRKRGWEKCVSLGLRLPPVIRREGGEDFIEMQPDRRLIGRLIAYRRKK